MEPLPCLGLTGLEVRGRESGASDPVSPPGRESGGQGRRGLLCRSLVALLLAQEKALKPPQLGCWGEALPIALCLFSPKVFNQFLPDLAYFSLFTPTLAG